MNRGGGGYCRLFNADICVCEWLRQGFTHSTNVQSCRNNLKIVKIFNKLSGAMFSLRFVHGFALCIKRLALINHIKNNNKFYVSTVAQRFLRGQR